MKEKKENLREKMVEKERNKLSITEKQLNKMTYKEKQEYFKERSKRGIVFYDTGKRVTKKGNRRIKGVPYVKSNKLS